MGLLVSMSVSCLGRIPFSLAGSKEAQGVCKAPSTLPGAQEVATCAGRLQ